MKDQLTLINNPLFVHTLCNDTQILSFEIIFIWVFVQRRRRRDDYTGISEEEYKKGGWRHPLVRDQRVNRKDLNKACVHVYVHIKEYENIDQERVYFPLYNIYGKTRKGRVPHHTGPLVRHSRVPLEGVRQNVLVSWGNTSTRS